MLPMSFTPRVSAPASLCAWRADRPRDRTVAEGGWNKKGVYPGAAGNEDVNVLGPVGDPDMISVADLGEPALAPVLEPLHAAGGKSRQWNPGTLEKRIAKLPLADAVARERSGVLGADHEQRPGWKDDVVVAEPQRGADEMLEDVLTGLAAIGEDVLWR